MEDQVDPDVSKSRLGPITVDKHGQQELTPSKSMSLSSFCMIPTGTLLGGIVFRNVLVHYDVSSDRVGFGLTECAALGSDIRPPCSIFDPKVVGVSWGLRD